MTRGMEQANGVENTMQNTDRRKSPEVDFLLFQKRGKVFSYGTYSISTDVQ